MGELKQCQKGGDNSIQNQIGTQIVQVGIDEKRVREICDEKIKLALKGVSAEAEEIARRRIDALVEKLVRRIGESPSCAEAFADPAVQRDVAEAQIAAAESERDINLDLLAELLYARIANKPRLVRKRSVRRAIEIVPELEEEELTALTALLFCVKYHINSRCAMNCESYFAALDERFSAILRSHALPRGGKWISNMNFLNCVEINHALSFKKFEDYCSEIANGVLCVGIAKGTSSHENAIKVLNECGIGASALVQNDLLPEYVRIPVARLDDLSMLSAQNLGFSQLYGRVLDDREKEGLKAVIGMYSKDPVLMKTAKEAFVKKMSEYESLRRFKDWLNALPYYFALTPVGEAIAYVNARRCIPDLPVIELE